MYSPQVKIGRAPPNFRRGVTSRYRSKTYNCTYDVYTAVSRASEGRQKTATLTILIDVEKVYAAAHCGICSTNICRDRRSSVCPCIDACSQCLGEVCSCPGRPRLGSNNFFLVDVSSMRAQLHRYHRDNCFVTHACCRNVEMTSTAEHKGGQFARGGCACWCSSPLSLARCGAHLITICATPPQTILME